MNVETLRCVLADFDQTAEVVTVTDCGVEPIAWAAEEIGPNAGTVVLVTSTGQRALVRAMGSESE